MKSRTFNRSYEACFLPHPDLKLISHENNVHYSLKELRMTFNNHFEVDFVDAKLDLHNIDDWGFLHINYTAGWDWRWILAFPLALDMFTTKYKFKK